MYEDDVAVEAAAAQEANALVVAVPVVPELIPEELVPAVIVLVDKAFEVWALSPTLVGRLLIGITVAVLLLIFIVTGVELADTRGSLAELEPVVDVETLVTARPIFAPSITWLEMGVEWETIVEEPEVVLVEDRATGSPPVWLSVDPEALVSQELFPDSLPPKMTVGLLYSHSCHLYINTYI